MITAEGNAKQRELTISAEAKNGKANIRIVGRISGWNANNSKDFQKKVDGLVAVHEDCDLYINSEGGSVFDATEINNQLKRFKNVTITVGAMAASAATYFIACYPTTVSSNTQIMIHKPSMYVSGNETQIQNQLKLLKNITKDYLAKYAKKTGKTPKQIEALWVSGDYWMSATEAKDEGFIDFINDEAEAVLTVEDVAVLEACGAPIIPQVTSQKQSENKLIMDRDELIAFLGLDAGATDEQIEAAKSKLKVDALKHRETEASKSANPSSEEDDDDEDAKKVKALVAKGLKEKKFKAAEAETYTALATADFDSAKKAIDAMPALPKLTDELNPSNPNGEAADDAAKANWKYEDYLDNGELEALWATNPKKAKQLEAVYLKN